MHKLCLLISTYTNHLSYNNWRYRELVLKTEDTQNVSHFSLWDCLWIFDISIYLTSMVIFDEPINRFYGISVSICDTMDMMVYILFRRSLLFVKKNIYARFYFIFVRSSEIDWLIDIYDAYSQSFVILLRTQMFHTIWNARVQCLRKIITYFVSRIFPVVY